MKVVLQKFISNSGFCSRRNAENLIRENKVLVNGKFAKLGARVCKSDVIKIGGKKIYLSEKKIYIKLNKPKGYVCTNKKFINEKNIFILVRLKDKLYSVGRLDKDSRGLILLTNDGELTQKMTHPSFKHEKEYEVLINRQEKEAVSNEEIISFFKKGVTISNYIVKAKMVEYLGNNKFKIVLTEGKKRQIRRMFGFFGLDVVDLKRVRIGELELMDLKEGKWKYLDNKEIALLLNC